MRLIMTRDERKRLRAEYLRKACDGFDWMFGADRQSNRRTFTQREDRAMDIEMELAKWALERHVGKDAQAKPTASGATCPACGGAAQGSLVGKQVAREIESRAGKVAVKRPGDFALPAAVAFFPLDRELGLGAEGFSPSIVAQIECAGGNTCSFA